MLSASAAYKAAIVGDSRRMRVRATIDLSSPDVVMAGYSCDSAAQYIKPEQVFDKALESTLYATLEPDRWALDGTYEIVPDSVNSITGQLAFMGGVLSEEDGAFTAPVWFELRFSGQPVLQGASIYFGTGPRDGVPADFVIEVKQGGVTYFSKEFSGNAERSVALERFTVYNPDAIRITVSRWSLPYRRLRIVEVVLGIYETWTDNDIAELSITQQTCFSCLSIPYGTCTIKVNNIDRRFEPRSKAGLFQSIEERQSIPVSIGPELEDGMTEFKQVGVFYQYSGGWKSSNNNIAMEWDLVDIIGLLSEREFIPPDELPTTLGGWIAVLLSQLGENFAERYRVDPSYKDLEVTVASGDEVDKKQCGDILRWVCMAAGVFPRADAATGYLAAEPYWNQGGKLDLDNLTGYPVMKANDDIAALIFELSGGTKYVVGGTVAASNKTVTVKNPFLHTQEAALAAARMILSTYGGNQIVATGRGDMLEEIGDVDTVWLDESSATVGRRMSQAFTFSNGVLKNCQSVLLQPDGGLMYQNRVVITKDGTWTVPEGITSIRIILVAGGSGGADGENGTYDAAGSDGADGNGGKVFAQTIGVNAGQTFAIVIGQGGAVGEAGTATRFGSISTDSGEVFETSYTDITSGEVYARPGVPIPLDHTGDGGKGGTGGTKGDRKYTSGSGGIWSVEIYSRPGTGGAGVAGASGCVVVYWDKE